VQNLLKIGSGVPELEDPEKWHFPLKAFIALTTVLRYRADCDYCSLFNEAVDATIKCKCGGMYIL